MISLDTCWIFQPLSRMIHEARLFMNNHIILLSGGSGRRLWPLSTPEKSKQFLHLIPDGAGGEISMLSRMYQQLTRVLPSSHVVVATSDQQVPLIRAELSEEIEVVPEPCRRNTFAAIALALRYLRDVSGAAQEDSVVVLPVDVFTEERYFQVVKKMLDTVTDHPERVTLMGITPTYPATRYGYILPDGRFREKPDEETARYLVEEGALWNGGVFAFNLGMMLSITEGKLNKGNYAELLETYARQKSISFDYEVLEHLEKVAVVPYSGAWNDIGTWDALLSEIGPQKKGTAVIYQSSNTSVLNETSLPVITLGTRDLVVVASESGILISDLSSSVHLKEALEELDSQA